MSRDEKSGYYDFGGIEVVDVIKAKLTPEQYEGYLLGNLIKYSLRCNFKGSKDRDKEKMANYAKWLNEETGEPTDGLKTGCNTCKHLGNFGCNSTGTCLDYDRWEGKA